MEKKRFKMYKKGKLWLVAPIIFIGLLGGAAFSSKESAVYANEISVEENQIVVNDVNEPKGEIQTPAVNESEQNEATVQENEVPIHENEESSTTENPDDKSLNDAESLPDEIIDDNKGNTSEELPSDVKPEESTGGDSLEATKKTEQEEKQGENEKTKIEPDSSQQQVQNIPSNNVNKEENKETLTPSINKSNQSVDKVTTPSHSEVQTKSVAPVSIPIYRVYNPNSGEHLHTMNSFERDYLVRLGWRNEGISMRVLNTGKQLFRIYNPNSGEHFYTLSAKERDKLKKYGWRYEGVAWLTPFTGLPMYRVYNPNTRGAGAHHYTMLQSERDFLVRAGWRSEGISWYTLGAASPIDFNFLGINRQYIINELSKHQNDKYYLGTPYKGLTVNNAQQYMKPGVSMNCTGFVARVIQNAGGNLSKIINLSNNWGGLANAYNWRNALNSSVTSYQYKSIADMLKSGKAKKGDIIYFEPNYSVANYDCHIGFFWGNNSHENKMWHSVPAVNKISSIYAPSGYSKVIIYSM